MLLNLDARYASSSGRRRATLAHEICHLLVDRGSALPLVEVLGGRTAEHVERRASGLVDAGEGPCCALTVRGLGRGGSGVDLVG